MNSESTRNKIISVASRLFGQYGFHKTSMDEIAKTSRKAKGSLYYHFSTKEDLFTEVVQAEINNLKKHLNQIVDNKNLKASEKLIQYDVARMKVLGDSPNYHEMLRADFYEHFDFADDLRNNFMQWEKNTLSKIFNEGIEKKEFHIDFETEILAEVHSMVLKGLEIPFFVQKKHQDLSPYFDSLIGIFVKGLEK